MPRIDVSLQIPETLSPVPRLCSVHVTDSRGGYGDASVPGNCSGELIADLLEYFDPDGVVLDPMEGSGTCGDVCAELGLAYQGFDLAKDRFDATKASAFQAVQPSAFCFLHPPYWDMVVYSDDPRCLSHCDSLDDFLRSLSAVVGNCKDVLTAEGRFAILIGDFTKRGRYAGLPFETFQIAKDHGLRLSCPEIIRLQHGATSTRKRYRSSFIPRVHDVCFVFERA